MKKSTIVLIAGAAFLILAVVTSIVVVRVQFDQYRSGHADATTIDDFKDAMLVAEGLPGGTQTFPIGVEGTKTLAYEDFEELSFRGSWKVLVKQGVAYSVEIGSPSAGNFQIVVGKQGRRLEFVIHGRGIGWNGAGATATITVPRLSAIEAQGSMDAVVEGLNADTLSLELSGGSNLVISSGTVGKLVAELNGAYQVDLATVSVRDAQVEANGAGLVELNMNGGSLQGHVNGAVTLHYTGSVSGVNVSTSGMSSVGTD